MRTEIRELTQARPRKIQIPITSGNLEGELSVPPGARGVVVFAHGSGSSRHSPRNQYVARVIRESGIGTLLFDLLTPEEEAEDSITAELRFDIDSLARRLITATRWLSQQREARRLGIGFFGSSTGAAVALMAAARLNGEIQAVVSRGGRPDLAGRCLAKVECPVLLIVGGRDELVLQLNEEALERLRHRKELVIVPGATHLFEEEGALEEVARVATAWFSSHLVPCAEGTGS